MLFFGVLIPNSFHNCQCIGTIPSNKAKFGTKYAFLYLGQNIAFVDIFVQCRTTHIVNKVYMSVLLYVLVTKILVFLLKSKMVGPNATKFGPKIGIFCQSRTVHSAKSMTYCRSVGGCGARALLARQLLWCDLASCLQRRLHFVLFQIKEDFQCILHNSAEFLYDRSSQNVFQLRNCLHTSKWW